MMLWKEEQGPRGWRLVTQPLTRRLPVSVGPLCPSPAPQQQAGVKALQQ